MNRSVIESAQRGDHGAFTELAAGSVDRLYATALLILTDRDSAHDATQEALVRAWRDLPKLRNPDAFRTWLHRLLVHACYDEARRGRRQAGQLERHEPAVDDTSASLADREMVERGLRRLSGEHRTTLVLRHYLGLSVPEIADTLSIPLGTAKSRLHHALKAMRAALEADERMARQAKERPA